MPIPPRVISGGGAGAAAPAEVKRISELHQLSATHIATGVVSAAMLNLVRVVENTASVPVRVHAQLQAPGLKNSAHSGVRTVEIAMTDTNGNTRVAAGSSTSSVNTAMESPADVTFGSVNCEVYSQDVLAPGESLTINLADMIALDSPADADVPMDLVMPGTSYLLDIELLSAAARAVSTETPLINGTYSLAVGQFEIDGVHLDALDSIEVVGNSVGGSVGDLDGIVYDPAGVHANQNGPGLTIDAWTEPVIRITAESFPGVELTHVTGYDAVGTQLFGLDIDVTVQS